MSRRKRINWKKQLRRESFYLKRGRFPSDKEMAEKNNGPKIMFGMNTATR